MKAFWTKCTEVSGFVSEKEMPIRIKDTIYKTIVKPAMTFGSECWAVNILHPTEMPMLRWARSNTKKDLIMTEDIWREANIAPMTTLLGKKRLRRYCHV